MRGRQKNQKVVSRKQKKCDHDGLPVKKAPGPEKYFQGGFLLKNLVEKRAFPAPFSLEERKLALGYEGRVLKNATLFLGSGRPFPQTTGGFG